MNYGVKGTRTSILQIQQEPLPGGPIGAGGGRDQLAPTPYQLPRLARPEGCCDMSCDCLSKYHGRASRDALLSWSGWTVLLQVRLPPGDICAGSRDATHTGRAADRMGYLCDIGPRDGGPTTLTHMGGHRDTAPLEHALARQPEVMSRLLHVWGPGWDRWSLHIAGLNNMGYATRLH